MEKIRLEKIEQDIVNIIIRQCEIFNVKEEVNSDFCPGKFIMSQALVSIVPEIESLTGIKIPLECYIFHDNNKDKKKISIKEAVLKLIKNGKYE